VNREKYEAIPDKLWQSVARLSVLLGMEMQVVGYNDFISVLQDRDGRSAYYIMNNDTNEITGNYWGVRGDIDNLEYLAVNQMDYRNNLIHGLMDRQGDLVLSVEYKQLFSLDSGCRFWVFSKRSINYLGCFDLKEKKMIFEEEYRTIKYVNPAVFVVKKCYSELIVPDNNWEIINIENNSCATVESVVLTGRLNDNNVVIYRNTWYAVYNVNTHLRTKYKYIDYDTDSSFPNYALFKFTPVKGDVLHLGKDKIEKVADWIYPQNWWENLKQE